MRKSKSSRLPALTAAAAITAVLTIAAGCASTRPAGPEQEAATDALRIIERNIAGLDRFTLPNGMTCLVREDRSAPVVSMQFWIRSGSIHEGQYLGAGISHAIEHMIFKGTPTRKPADITREIHDVGGYINAYTTFDRTVFHADLPSRNWRVGLDVLSDALMNAAFPEEKWKKERNVILREIAMGRDDAERVIGKLLWRTAYAAHPYRFPVIGEEHLFKTIGRNDLASFFKRRYVPDNVTAAIVGDVDSGELRSALERTFAGYLSGPADPAYVPAEPRQVAPRFARETGPYKVSRLEWAYHTVPVNHPDAALLDVLSVIAGQGRSSRLARNIRDRQQLVETISAMSYTPGYPGLFAISASFDPDREQEVIAAIDFEIADWLTVPFTGAEIEKAGRILLSSELSDLQTMKGQATSFASGEFFARDPGYSATYMRRIAEATPTGIMEAARKYLAPENRTLVILCPAGTGNDKASAGPAETCSGKIVKRELDNGITLLVREDHRLPFVYFCAALGGGLLAESETETGLTQLMADLMARGTSTRTSDEIADLLDSRGAVLSPFAGYNSFGLRGRCLSADAGLFLDLAADCLLNPSFPDREISTQKRIQLAAVARRNESPFHAAERELRRMIFGRHPYARFPAGTEETVQTLDRAKVSALHRKLSVAGNMALSVFGHVTPDEATELVRRAFRTVRAGTRPSLRSEPAQPILPGRSKRIEPKEQAIVLAGFPGVDMKDPRSDALEVLQTVMSGLSSDLAIAVREERGLAYYVGAFQQTGLEPGMFVMYAGVRPDVIDEAQTMFKAEINRVREKGIRADELSRAVNRIIADHEMKLQDNMGLAMECALHELYGLGWEHVLSMPDRIRAVTLESVEQAAVSVLDPDRMAVSIVLPEEKESATIADDKKGDGNDGRRE